MLSLFYKKFNNKTIKRPAYNFMESINTAHSYFYHRN